VSARGAAAVRTTNPTPPDDPLRIVYSVADRAGNQAARAERRIFVGCPNGATLCEGEAGWFCSLQGAACVGAPLPEPPPPAAATTIHLVGPAVVRVEQFQPYGKCSTPWLQELPCDRGAAATDPVEGDVTAFIDACTPGHPFPDFGLTPCGINTSVAGEYTVTFSIVDSASSERVAVSRTVVVVVLGEQEGAVSDFLLQLRPVAGVMVGQPVLVPQGQEYAACSAAMLQRGDLCEPGAPQLPSLTRLCSCAPL